MALELYNTATKRKEVFDKPAGSTVGLYDCGPTVYDYAHLGNLRAYIFADILRRTLEYNNYEVNQVINVTDIGHLSGDGDDGEDKMTKALKREGKPMTLASMRELADFYFSKFKEDLIKLNIKLPSKFPFASDHITEDVELIEKLDKGGYVYKTSDGLYFDTGKYKDYGKLGGALGEDDHSRIGINPEKKSQRDFALWKFNNELGYDSSLGKGFPGWHIECSAMSMKYLGESFDIHTGGIDHISVHHNNEIAQAEAATGKPLAKFWLHNEFLNINEEKISKSIGNTLYLRDLEPHNISPIGYRFWLLMANYRSLVNFNWDALMGAENALKRLYRLFLDLGEEDGNIIKNEQIKFHTALNNDLNTPEALVVLWNTLGNENYSKGDKKATVLDFDKVLGLGFDKIKEQELPKEISDLAKKRDMARNEKNWQESDNLRDKLIEMGYEVSDTTDGTKVRKI